MRGCQKKMMMMQHDDGWMMVQPSLPLASSQVGDWSPALLGERRVGTSQIVRSVGDRFSQQRCLKE